ncbi:hypothetical protein [Frigoribacterium salinisoli]
MTTTPGRPDPVDAGDEGHRDARPPVHEPQAVHEPEAREARGESDPSWQAVGERRRPSRIALTSFVPLVASIVVGQVVARVLVHGTDDPDWPALAAAGGLMVATVLVGYALVALVLRLAYGPARVDLRRGLLRAGRRTVPLGDVTWAKVVLRDPAGRTPVAVLTFGAEGGPRVAVPVRDVRGAVATEEERAVVAAALARTSITVPRSAADPTGRFARYNFPGRVSKDDAIALVEHPTGRDDLLPESATAALEQARYQEAQRRERKGRRAPHAS